MKLAHTPRWPRTIAAAAAAGLLLLTAACGGGGTGDAAKGAAGADDYAVDGTFTYALSGDPGTLSPLMAVAAAARQVTPFAYDHLLSFDAKGSPKGWLAESWKETPTSVTYTLKKDITCSDGSKLTAQTVADNFTFVDDEKNGSPLRATFLPSGISVKADDAAGTLTVTSSAPSSFLLFQTGNLDIVCQSVLDDPDSASAATNGTGMYQMTKAVPNDSYTFERKKTYTWGYDDTTAETPGLPKTVIVRIVPNESTLTNLLLSGEVNAGVVTGPDVDRLDAAKLASVGSARPAGELFYNQAPGRPTADPLVRQALTLGLNLDDLTKVISGGKGTRAESMVTLQPRPCTYTSTEGLLPNNDPAKAGTLLDQAGWAKGADGTRAKDGKPLALTYVYGNLTDGQKAAAELAQKAWQDLGAKVTLKGGDNNFVITNTLTPDTQSWDITGLTVSMTLPSQLVSFVSGPGAPKGNNFANIKNTAYDDLAAKASQQTGEAACTAWQQAEQALLKDLSVVPFANRADLTYLKNAAVLGDFYTPVGPALRVLKK